MYTAAMALSFHDVQDVLRTSGRFVFRRPAVLAMIAKQALDGRVAVPLDALRWFLRQPHLKRPELNEITLESRPPALVFGATLSAMGTRLRVAAALEVQEVELRPELFHLSLRIKDLAASVLGGKDSAVSALLRAGALDLTRPGDFLRFLPTMPAVIIEASGDRIVLDLFKLESLRKHAILQLMLPLVVSRVTMTGIFTEGEYLVFDFAKVGPKFRWLPRRASA